MYVIMFEGVSQTRSGSAALACSVPFDCLSGRALPRISWAQVLSHSFRNEGREVEAARPHVFPVIPGRISRGSPRSEPWGNRPGAHMRAAWRSSCRSGDFSSGRASFRPPHTRPRLYYARGRKRPEGTRPSIPRAAALGRG